MSQRQKQTIFTFVVFFFFLPQGVVKTHGSPDPLSGDERIPRSLLTQKYCEVAGHEREDSSKYSAIQRFPPETVPCVTWAA